MAVGVKPKLVRGERAVREHSPIRILRLHDTYAGSRVALEFAIDHRGEALGTEKVSLYLEGIRVMAGAVERDVGEVRDDRLLKDGAESIPIQDIVSVVELIQVGPMDSPITGVVVADESIDRVLSFDTAVLPHEDPVSIVVMCNAVLEPPDGILDGRGPLETTRIGWSLDANGNTSDGRVT